MEDILASIRRILSEDEVEEKAAAPEPAPTPEPEPEPAPASQDDIDAMFAAPPPAPEPEPEPLPQDDIDAMFAIPEPEPEPEPVYEPEPEPEDDILELTDEMVLDQPEPIPAFSMDEFEEEDDYPPPPPPPRRRPAQSMDDESLLSPPVADRSTSLLSDLAREIVRQRAIGIGNGGITLEDMVRELLRPVLKEWLDQNLPYMIERIIKQEIEKMVNRAENL